MRMSKKQQTLLQSWANSTKIKTTPKKVGEGNRNPLEVSLIESDEDDELLSKALEESLKQYEASNKTSTASFVRDSNGPSTSTAPPSATPVESLPGFDNQSGSTWIYPTNYPVRKYQRDIVESCLFHNTLVSLPTGLGKTFIAAVVMYNFFRWYPEGKVIFLAPTKPLVAQQIEACYNITGIPLETSSEMTGALAPEVRKKEWREKRVFFLTPQVIANDISRGTCPVNNVKCLVLDEAHKALGNYAYVQVVNELTKHGAMFRILALSATPGSDMKAIQQVLGNLQISRIEMRNEESPDILPYTHSRIVDKIVVPLGPEVSAVRDTFLHILGSVARRLLQQNLLFTKDIGSLSRSAILKAREIFRLNPPTNFIKAKAGMVEGDFALCITLTHALELLQLHGIRGFYNFLASKTDPVSEGGQDGAHHNRTRTEMQKIPEFRRMMDELKPKITANYISHPKLKKLLEIVLKHFRRCEEEKQTTRVMIFSQYRDSVEEIASLFKNHEPLIKAMSFVGHGGNGKSKVKFTQADQLRVVKQFRDGNYNTLVATCVGEEGLDIGDVDLIVCYDAHKSPVRLVQRMGRTGRKRDGRIVMLMTEGKEEHVYNSSVYTKKTLCKNIQSDKLKEYLSTNCPRMIPRHIHPRCHEMPMTVQQKYPVQNPRQRDSTSGANNIRKGKTTKSYYLSDAEYDYYVQHLKPDQPVAVLPQCYDPYGPVDSDLKLNQWTTWQSTLQLTHTIGHSAVTQAFVEVMELISAQQEASASFHYDKEMKSHLNLGDVSLPFNRPGSSADYHLSDETRADAEVSDIFSYTYNQNLDLPTDLVEKSREPPTWDRRGLFSPTFLQLFNHQSSVVNDKSFRAPLDFPSPPPRNFHLSPGNSAPDEEMDLSMFPSCRIRPNRECVKGLSDEASFNREPFIPLPDESAMSASLMPEANFDVDFDTQPIASQADEVSSSTAKILPPSGKLSDASSRRLIAKIDESNLKRTDSASSNDPIHAPRPGERVESSPPAIPVANFDVDLDLDLSDFGDDIIPPTPPRGKEEKKYQPTNQPSSSQLKTPPRATNEVEWKADPSPILSQRRRKSLKRKLELVCSTPAVTVKEEKRVRIEASDCQDDENDVEIPASQNFWSEFDRKPLKEKLDVQSVKMEPDATQPASADYLLSVSQIVHFINSSPLSEPEVKFEVKSEPLPCPPRSLSPHGDDNEAIAVSISPQVVEANFDFDIDFLECSPVVACKTSANKRQQEASVPVKPLTRPGQPSPPKGVDQKSVWDDGFELSWEEMEAVEKAAVNVVSKEPARALDEEDDDVIIESVNHSSSAARSDNKSVTGRFDDSGLSGSAAPGNRCTTRNSRVSSVPKIEVIDLDEDVEADFAMTPLKHQSAQSSDDDEESPVVARCKSKSRRNQFLMTQSTPKMSAAPPEVTKKSRRVWNAVLCSFIEQEASVSSDVSCSEDEDEHANKDDYEPSFVDDLMATQHDTDEMRAVYLRSIKSPVAHQGFVFRRPQNQKEMNYSDIYSQPNVEQDSDYQLDSFCVDNDEIEHFEETALSQMEPQLLEPEPDAAKAKFKTGARKRIIAPSDSTDSEESPPKIIPTVPVSAATSTSSAAASNVARPLIVSTSSSSALSTPSPVIQRSSVSSFDLSREERLRKQKEKQEEFRRNRMSKEAATTSSEYSSGSSSVVSVSEPLPPRPVQPVSVVTNRTASTALSILVSSRQVAVCSEIISSLRVQSHCLPHVCSFDGADFVLSPQMGVIRKLHSDFANGAQRTKLQEQIKSLMVEYERPVVIVEADKPARDQWHRGFNSAAVGVDSNSVIFKSNPPYLYLTQAALAQTNAILINTTTQQETAKALSDLAKREVSKGFVLPDADKLSAHQKKLFEFLLRLPPLNPAAALLMATRFNSLREIATSSSEMISRKCQITAGQARNVHQALRIRLPRS